MLTFDNDTIHKKIKEDLDADASQVDFLPFRWGAACVIYAILHLPCDILASGATPCLCDSTCASQQHAQQLACRCTALKAKCMLLHSQLEGATWPGNPRLVMLYSVLCWPCYGLQQPGAKRAR